MRHCIFDTETTNLIHNSLQPIHKQPRIIEIFALVLDDKQDWAEVEAFHHYLDPGVPINPDVTKITGITAEQLKGKPNFRDIAHEWQEFVAGVDVMVAHNLSYDVQIVNFEFARIQTAFKWPSRMICTVESTEHLKGFRLNLMSLHEYLFGVGFENAHSAEHDVRATARCYVELVKRGEI